MLKKYTEKPSYSFNLGMGINILNAKAASNFLVKGEYLDMPNLMLKIQDHGTTSLSVTMRIVIG
jgi:hypothetical protein